VEKKKEWTEGEEYDKNRMIRNNLTNACTQTGLAPEGEGAKFDIMVMGKVASR